MPSATTASRRSCRAASKATSTARPTASSRCARAAWRRRLAALGVKPGDRVGTLAWNGPPPHGAVITPCRASGARAAHLQPRGCTPTRSVYIADHADDQVLCFDLTFLPLVEAIAPACQGHQGLCGDDLARPHAGRQQDRRAAVLRRPCSRHRTTTTPGPKFDENLASSLLLHLGHHGQPQGRALQPTARRCCTPSRSRCPMR